MEPGRIHLLNSGTEAGIGITQTIAQAVGNRLYRVTNDGGAEGAPGNMHISVTRSFLFFSITSSLDLAQGRSVDVIGSTLTVSALDSLQLFGSYDTI
jgi:hypothetical protein